MIDIFFFIAGVLVGSFLNTVIRRTPQGESALLGRSRCQHCKHQLAWYEIIPFVSFFIQGGTCRYCQKKISWVYPIVEAATGLLFLLAYQYIGWSLELLVVLVIMAYLVIIFFIDALYSIIPDSIVLPGIITALIFGFMKELGFTSILFGMVLGAGFFLVQFLVSRGRWVGGGDIRLGLMMGACLGARGVLIALFLSYITGAMVAIALLIFKRKKMQDHIPFGTFLSASTIILILWNQEIMNYAQKIFAGG